MQYKNFEIQTILRFLDAMKLSGRASLGRSAFKKVLAEKQNEYAEEQTEIVEEFDAWINQEEGRFDTSNPDLNQANLDLANKEIEISIDSPFLDDFVMALEKYDEGVSGAEADVYAMLYENFITSE